MIREDSAEVTIWRGTHSNDARERLAILKQYEACFTHLRNYGLRGTYGDWRIVIEGQREDRLEDDIVFEPRRNRALVERGPA